jgi:flagellar protein FlgJ
MQVGGVAPGPPPIPAPPDATRLRQVAQDFEALVVSRMLASMRRAGGKTLLEGQGERLYREMMDDELGRVLARGGGLGLADVLVRDLLRQTAAPKKASSAAAERSMGTVSGPVTPGRPEGDSQ